MTIYLIENKRVNKNATDFQDRLKAVHGTKQRPLCMCKDPGIPMYVARISATAFAIKRMPNTGKDHEQNCDSFETPAALSGLGEVMGQAIKENPDDGSTTLKLDFSLSKGAHRAPPATTGEEKDSVKTDGKKLTLRGTLHYLWEEAGFNRWSPAMSGKRNWGVIRKYLLEAAQNKIAKGDALGSLLYIPEVFFLERKDEIEARREKQIRQRASTTDKKRLLILIGQIKEFKEAGFGYQMIVKHVPDRAFNINKDLGQRLVKRFERDLKTWQAFNGTQLMTIATFAVDRDSIATIEEMALMTVNENWLPFEGGDERNLLEKLTEGKRRFVKTLRYNLPSSRPIASAILTDRPDQSMTALYIIPELTAADEEKLAEKQAKYQEDLERIIQESEIPSWRWNPAEESMPQLPV